MLVIARALIINALILKTHEQQPGERSAVAHYFVFVREE